ERSTRRSPRSSRTRRSESLVTPELRPALAQRRRLQTAADEDELTVLVRHAVAAVDDAGLFDRREALFLPLARAAHDDQDVAGSARRSPEPVVVVAADRRHAAIPSELLDRAG